MPDQSLEQTLIAKALRSTPPNDAVPSGTMVFMKKPFGQLTMNDVQPMPYDRAQLALEHLKTQMPKESAALRGWGPMNEYEKSSYPEATAVASPFDMSIGYNPNMLPEHQSDVDDTFAHELTHIGQFNKALPLRILRALQGGVADYFTPYHNRPDEQEAFGKMLQRQLTRRDIKLPKDK